MPAKFVTCLLLGCCLLGSAPRLGAASEDEVLAAARAANAIYQRHLQVLFQDLGSEEGEERILALRRLGRTGDPTVIPRIVPYLDADVHDARTVQAAAYALINLDAVQAGPDLRRLAARGEFDDQKDRAVRLAALNALAQLGQMQEHDYKRESGTDNPQTRAVGVTDLGTLKVEDAGPILADALKDDRQHIRRMAAIGLGRLGNSEYGPQLTEALTDSDALVRRYVAEALVLLDYKPAIPYLLMAMEANVAGGDMVDAMRHLAGEDFGFDPFANILDRQDAVERGFSWWTAHEAELTQ